MWYRVRYADISSVTGFGPWEDWVELTEGKSIVFSHGGKISMTLEKPHTPGYYRQSDSPRGLVKWWFADPNLTQANGWVRVEVVEVTPVDD